MPSHVSSSVRARYRTTEHGTRVVTVPTHCPRGAHVLADVGYRMYETKDTLHVTCAACVEQSHVDSEWALVTTGPRAESAEFDDRLYRPL